MKNILFKASKLLCNLAFGVAVIASNVTCARYYYQEELDEQVASLNRFRHE